MYVDESNKVRELKKKEKKWSIKINKKETQRRKEREKEIEKM